METKVLRSYWIFVLQYIDAHRTYFWPSAPKQSLSENILEKTQSIRRSKKMILRTILDSIKYDFEVKERVESKDEDAGHMLVINEGDYDNAQCRYLWRLLEDGIHS